MLAVGVAAEIVDVRTVVHFQIFSSVLFRQSPTFAATIVLCAGRVHRNLGELLTSWQLVDLQKHEISSTFTASTTKLHKLCFSGFLFWIYFGFAYSGTFPTSRASSLPSRCTRDRGWTKPSLLAEFLLAFGLFLVNLVCERRNF
jgi:hypothetical protein